MKNAWIVKLKSEAELYLENLSQFEAEYYGEAFQTKKQELEGQEEIFCEKYNKCWERIVNTTTRKELANVLYLKEQREKEKEQLEEQIDHSKKHIEEYERDYKERERKRKASITRLKNQIEKNHGEIKKNQEKINPLLFWKKYEDEKNAITSCERRIKDCEAELAAISAEPETNQGPALKEKLSVLKENLSTLENELKKLEKQEITIRKELDSEKKECAAERDELFRNFCDSAQVISYRAAVGTVWKKFQKIGSLNPCLQYAKEHYSALYFFFRLAGETLFLDKSDAFSLENSPSIPCKLCSEKLVEKMQSAPIKMQGLKQSVSFRIQREFLVNPKTSSNFAVSAKRSNFDQDPLLRKALEIVIAEGRASTSLLQRELSIGYAYAAKLIDLMAKMNAVGPYAGSRPREVLWTKKDLNEQPMSEDLEFEPTPFETIEDSASLPEEFVGKHFKKEAVLEILDLIETLSDEGDLPELFVRFSGEVLSEDFEAKELFEEFKRLYRETPEQILVTEQRYFMERKLEEQREANEKMLEEQRDANEKLLEEQREANRILEEAERQRAREEARRAEEEWEHNRRMEALSEEANRQKEEYYSRQQERQREEERERASAQTRAQMQCLSCANRGPCPNSYRGVINCASYVARR